MVRRRYGSLILKSLSQTRSSFSSVVVSSPTPTTLPPPPITESVLLRSIEYSQRHFIEHLAPLLTPSILPSDLTSFDLTSRCFSFCTLYRFSYPKPSVHRLLHPLILTGAANPESIFNELARTRELLNVNTTSVFDALITAYCELKKPDEALKSFYLMKEKGFLPKIETCNYMLKLFLKLNRNQVEEFIRHMDTLGLKPAIYEYNTLLHYGGDKFQVACVMFQTLNDSGLFLDAYSYNSYNFVMYKEGRLEEASDSLAKMLESESGLVPHAVTYDALIHQQCPVESLLYNEKSIRAYVVHRLLHLLILTGAVNLESIFNELARTRELLNVNTTSVFDALITAYCELKKPDEALKSFYLMKEKGFLPKIETCNHMLKLFLKLNKNQVEEFIRHMDTLGLKPAIYEYNTLLHYRGDKFHVACVMFQTLNDSGLFLDAYSYNSYNFVMYKEGRLEEASDSLAKMLESESRLVPHAVTYDALIHQQCPVESLLYNEKSIRAYAVHRLLHLLILTGAANPESIFNELARTRELLNVNTTSVFDALITAYCELKKPDEALKSFYLMKEKGFLPKIETCNHMLKLFLKLNRNQVEEFIRHMDTLGLKSAIYEYNTLLHYRGDKFHVACVMFQTLNDSGLFLDAYSYNSYNFVMYK
ncbi:pentatricopeptide repeat-containing protein At2g15630, mitochondrial-like [Lotus japonicus]|uniref:pentatricopeptide repeat-containing protein At2g15630, mitochondrial-like n=1 Tax=Lotus japonicus TaxID=34305 RepID=UPI00258994BB|nr:pentatricopeptide repeat-containing protein At2g15630, mitochondrial-like [Lotus japonicus]